MAEEIFGIKRYTFDFKAEIEFERDGTWIPSPNTLISSGHVLGDLRTEPLSFRETQLTSSGIFAVHKGTVGVVQDNVQLLKSDNGWKIEAESISDGELAGAGK